MLGVEKKEYSRSQSGAAERQRERDGQESQYADDSQLSPSSPTRQAWKPMQQRSVEGGRQGDQDSAEFSTGAGGDHDSRHVFRQASSTQEEQFTGLSSEASATPNTLTSEQEESSDAAAQQEQEQVEGDEAAGDEAAGESREEGLLRRDASVTEEMTSEQEAVSDGQFQECVMPEQEAI